MASEAITPSDVVFFLAVLGAISGMWWRMEAKMDATRKSAEERVKEVKTDAHHEAQAAHATAVLVGQQLAELRLHCAETYVSKSGLRELRDEIMDGMRGLKGGVDHLNERMDRVIEGAVVQQQRPAGGRRANAPP